MHTCVCGGVHRPEEGDRPLRARVAGLCGTPAYDLGAGVRTPAFLTVYSFLISELSLHPGKGFLHESVKRTCIVPLHPVRGFTKTFDCILLLNVIVKFLRLVG